MESFTKYTILVVKEEGNTSQVLQAYDQDAAKSDKRCTRELLDSYICHIKYKIIQWKLILVSNKALNKVAKGTSWRGSSIKVNLCPSQQKPFK